MIDLVRLALATVGLVEHPDRSPRKRSGKWNQLSNDWIKTHPQCIACGNARRKFLDCHHRLPYHLYPELELDEKNLRTLCRRGPGGANCHLLIGHCGDWRAYNIDVDADAAWLRAIFDDRRFLRTETSLLGRKI